MTTFENNTSSSLLSPVNCTKGRQSPASAKYPACHRESRCHYSLSPREALYVLNAHTEFRTAAGCPFLGSSLWCDRVQGPAVEQNSFSNVDVGIWCQVDCLRSAQCLILMNPLKSSVLFRSKTNMHA